MRAAVLLGAALGMFLPVVSAISAARALQPEALNLIQTKAATRATGNIPDPLTEGANPSGVAGYVPSGLPYENPGDKVLTGAAFSLPEASECTVRPQTVVAIEKTRKTAAQMAASIGMEAENVAKRKAFIEEMTSYLNDRIRELNYVKKDLAEELRWVEATAKQIELLNKQEEQMKVNDILACMNNDKERTQGSAAQQNKFLDALQKKVESLNKEVTAGQQAVLDIQAGKEASAAGSKEAAP